MLLGIPPLGVVFGPPLPDPGVIFLDGIRLPFVKNMNRPVGETAGVFPGTGAFVVGPLRQPAGPRRRAVGVSVRPQRQRAS